MFFAHMASISSIRLSEAIMDLIQPRQGFGVAIDSSRNGAQNIYSGFACHRLLKNEKCSPPRRSRAVNSGARTVRRSRQGPYVEVKPPAGAVVAVEICPGANNPRASSLGTSESEPCAKQSAKLH